MTLFYDTLDTSLGRFSVAVDESKYVVATAFGKLPALKQRIAGCHRFVEKPISGEIRKQLQEYFRGKRNAFSLKLAPHGTEFQHTVWDALIRIPLGQTCSYGQIAERIGRPKAARAVGRANATNPICVIVPCHRVIGADGSFTGFAFGESIKRKLLQHENALPASLV